MMYKDGEFKEGKSRSDFDMTKKGEVWDDNVVLSKEELADIVKNNKNPFPPIHMKIGMSVGNVEGAKKVKFE